MNWIAKWLKHTTSLLSSGGIISTFLFIAGSVYLLVLCLYCLYLFYKKWTS